MAKMMSLGSRPARWRLGLLVLMCGVAAPARGQCPTHLFASDGAAYDFFGVSVAIDGDTAVVGAYGDDTGGMSAGSAYVFTRSGRPGQEVWTQQAHLFASDGEANDYFGLSVAIDGDTAVVGAEGDNTPAGSNAGSAYVFVRSGPPGQEVWTQQAHLFASDGEAVDRFGVSVAIDGDTVVVGAQIDDTPAGENAGSAYVFVRSGPPGREVWTQQAHLFASDGATGDHFGRSVAINGETAVVGAVDDDTPAGESAGSAYVFVRSGPPGREAWTQQAHLFVPAGSAYDLFGYSVAIDGDTAVVGAFDDDTPGGTNAGSAYVFVRSGRPGQEVWTQQAHLFASDGAGGDLFGWSVAIDGNAAVVGAHDDDTPGGTNAGSAYVFVRSGRPGQEVWTEQTHLFASYAETGDEFGFSVAIAGDTAVVGAHHDDKPGTNAGSAYVFDLNCEAARPADLDGDGDVDGQDLSMLLAQWTGAAQYAPCPPFQPADLNGDCRTNGTDLAILLGSWG